MTRSPWVLAALLLLLVLVPGSGRASERVRSEKGRFWIECRNAPLQDVLRELAAAAPMELWLDEGLEGKEVSVSLSGVTLKAAVEKLFEDVKVNYVVYLDSTNPEKVAKLYAGGGGGSAGRLGREPTVSSEAPAEGGIAGDAGSPPELDPAKVGELPDTQEVLGVLQNLLERRHAAGEADGDPSETAEPGDGDVPPTALPAELQELLKNLPQFPRGPFTPGVKPPPDGNRPPKKEKPH